MLASHHHFRLVTAAALAALFFLLVMLTLPAGLPDIELGGGYSAGEAPAVQQPATPSALGSDWTEPRLVSPLEQLERLPATARQ